MIKPFVLIFVIPYAAFCFSKEVGTSIFSNKKALQNKNLWNTPTLDDCRLMEEQVHGKTEIKYEYDGLNRLIEKKYLRLKYVEEYKYDANGYLIAIRNDSPNGFTIEFKYENGYLVSKTKRIKSLSMPIVSTYRYNASNELSSIAETYISTTTTEFKNGKAIKMTHPFIKYELDKNGLVTKSTSISDLKTTNIYKYDASHMLLVHEIYAEPGKKLMYKEFENSKIVKSKMGDEFVGSYKGFPTYINPFGESTFYPLRISIFSTNAKNGLLEKVYEKKTEHAVDGTGKLLSEWLDNSTGEASSIIYLYSGCPS